MIDLKTTQEQADQLVQRLPKKILEKMAWLEEEVRRDPKTDVITGIGAKIIHERSQWNAMNDVTFELSHNMDRAFLSSQEAYRNLDRIMVRTN
jgi:hypothetical protein